MKELLSKNDYEIKDEVTYCEKLIEAIEKEPKVAQVPAVKERLNLLKEVVEDYQTQLSYSSDEDARKGHKTAGGTDGTLDVSDGSCGKDRKGEDKWLRLCVPKAL